jgi:dipeptidyl aminopeptidase/acylaminoacyl peptidase
MPHPFHLVKHRINLNTKGNNMKKIYLYTLCLVCILLPEKITAQDVSLQLIYTITEGEGVQNLFWSSDSQLFAFQPVLPGVSENGQTWIEYNSRLSTSYETLDPLFSNTLTTQIVDEAIIELQFSENTAVFVSPNQRYVVTAQVTDTNDFSTIIIDAEKDRVFDIGITALGIWNAPEEFFVLWSIDSQSFVFATTALNASEPSFFYHVDNYVDQDARIDITQLDGFGCGEDICNPIGIYDLSDDGHMVLMQVAKNSTYPLAIWDTTGSHQVIDAGIRIDTSYRLTAAAFAPDNENDILVVDGRGLVRYSLETGETVVLRSDITSQRFRYARFSPNGESLALVDNTPGRPAAVYLLDIRDLAR